MPLFGGEFAKTGFALLISYKKYILKAEGRIKYEEDNMNTTRRNFIIRSTAAGILSPILPGWLVSAKEAIPGLRVGVCDWSIGKKSRGKVEALDAVKRMQLDGIQISPSKAEDVLSYAKEEVQKEYKEKSKQTGVDIASLGLTVTNKYPLAKDPRGPGWLEQTIDATHSFGANVILIAFFGKGNLLKKNAVDEVVKRLKKAAPGAKDKGVILGIENTLSALQNIQILDAVKHDSVQVYYDIANSTKSGYDVPAEIRMLKDRICEFHFKDNKGLFNSHNPEMGPIIEAVKDIKYKGWLILERAFGKDKEEYFKKNGEFVKKAFNISQEEGNHLKEKGFISLFNGKDLTGWREGLEGYAVENGVLVHLPKKTKGKRGRNLFTKKKYSNFILKLEFKLTPGANNGLAIRSPLKGNPSYNGMELQILDDTAEKWSSLKDYQFHGSLYGVIPAKKGFLKPVGEWNYQEVTARGNRIIVKLNGEVILDADISEFKTSHTLDGKKHSGLLRKKGHIGFLGHGSRVEFRNIYIKPLKE